MNTKSLQVCDIMCTSESILKEIKVLEFLKVQVEANSNTVCTAYCI